jgi:nucleoside-diphosphate-sugar epimerase
VAQPTIVLAGAAGDLGGRIASALIARGATVRALVRARVSDTDRNRLTRMGAIVAPADVSDVGSVAAACEGAACVVSALNGLRDVIMDRQSVLLDGAVKAGVPRFISSDYSADFTKTRPGDNRNLDLRREFMARADRAPIRITSILNGAFMDMLGAEMPVIQPRIHRVLHWGSADQPLDFTTKDNVAAYVAAAASDETTPRILRIAGDTPSARDIAWAMTDVTGEQYHTLWAGSIGSLGVMIHLAKLVAPQPRAAFPPWQGMQYMRDMFSGRGKLHPLDNDRYPDLSWTSVREQLAAGSASTAPTRTS